jgi:hypothetical protein
MWRGGPYRFLPRGPPDVTLRHCPIIIVSIVYYVYAVTIEVGVNNNHTGRLII